MEKDNLFIFNCLEFAEEVKKKDLYEFKDLSVKMIAYGYVMEVLKEIADYEICWYFKGEYYTEEEYRKKQDEFFKKYIRKQKMKIKF